jgi:hypothetical protein
MFPWMVNVFKYIPQWIGLMINHRMAFWVKDEQGWFQLASSDRMGLMYIITTETPQV